MQFLQVQSLTKRFGSTVAVDAVSFEVRRGEIYGLIGPNGSGKTTIAKMLAGLYEPTGGAIVIEGRDRFVFRETVNARLGYIPDNPLVYEFMAGSEYLDFTASLYGLDRSAYKDRLREILVSFPIEGILPEPVEAYSRGNKQKLMIIAALLHRPSFLIIDEPIVGLDLESTQKLRRLLEAFRRDGGSALITTHTLSFLDSFVDRVGLLDDGHLIEEGTLSSLREKAGIDQAASLDDIYRRLIRGHHGVVAD